MLHEFTVRLSEKELEQAIEKLTAAGIVNMYYETPFEVVQDDNGYGYVEKEDVEIELHIYGEEGDMEGLPDTMYTKIHDVLGLSKHELAYAPVNDQWHNSFEDIDLGNGWILSFPPFDGDEQSGASVMRFDPQASFGTGQHETTRDCLRFIFGHDFSGAAVLDLGAGSGILSVAAALKGATNVHAVDIEPIEREVLLNAELNGVDAVAAEQADLLSGSYQVEGRYDWIFINIGADETIGLFERHDLFNKAESMLISGLVEWNADRVMTAFRQAGWHITWKTQTNEWITLSAVKE
ncbi:50S ribosomal protein L11 methyltransferase [Bacillus marinisedimentorum]|uniref:50S ribosomal protein L11 methyltransferase n=1 Tax=Bacillus marinisedimentorum TaxID=1821260 RepID=UPI000872C47A|nr:50S ribosomal protein L11 methyltransferase [Bacillus marinisedimentorum]